MKSLGGNPQRIIVQTPLKSRYSWRKTGFKYINCNDREHHVHWKSLAQVVLGISILMQRCGTECLWE